MIFGAAAVIKHITVRGAVRLRKFIWYILAALVFGAVQLWVENSDVASGFFTDYIKPIFDDWSIPVIWSVLGLLALRQYYMGRINDLESEMKNEMELQIKANKQLASYRRKELFQSFIRSYVEREDAVHSVQLYKYTVKRRVGEITFKVEHIDGYVHEGIELNALGQIYFHLEKRIYNDFISAKAILDKHDNALPLIAFVRNNQSRFAALTPEDVTEYEATQFSVVQLAVDLIETWFERKYGQSVELTLMVLPPEVHTLLTHVKRTGILRSILLKNRYYRFSHTGSGEKHGRLYMARHIILWDVNHVFMVTVDPDILEEQTDELEQIQGRFITGLQKNFEVVYTGTEDGREGDVHGQAN